MLLEIKFLIMNFLAFVSLPQILNILMAFLCEFPCYFNSLVMGYHFSM